MQLFQEPESKEIQKHLRIFIQKLHENGLYHRDLGGNPRNIMFGEDGRVYIIDFGKGMDLPSGVSASPDEIYYDSIHDGRYDDDLSIVTMIEHLTESSRHSDATEHKRTIEALEKNLPIERIRMVSERLGILEKSIDQACHLSSGMSIKALISWLDRLLVKNDRVAPGEFIYYPKLLLGEKVSARMQPGLIEATDRGAAKLLVSLFLLSREDLKELQKTLETRKWENASKGKKLLHIDVFSRFIIEVLDSDR